MGLLAVNDVADVEVADNVMEAISSSIFGSTGVWFIIGAVLVWFMQCGFAMVETGFTRAKNAGNIIMKNLMDFCLGTIVFVLLGAGLLMGENALGGFLGVPDYSMFTDFYNYDWSSFFFNLVFCATAATIVSGAMAERTKFSTYCIYSMVISLFVYPIEAHWVWGGGWLTREWGTAAATGASVVYIDFAGSSLIHMVGGISSLIGAWMLGPRLGKYERGADGKVTKVRAIPGHSLTLGALGVFILWFCWYGFNGAAATSTSELAYILTNTTIATAVSTTATMCFTWIRNKKPDVSMTLNGSLAGLVAITAGCQAVDALGSAVIGLVAGILVVVVVEFVDKVLHVDDPVGAIAVHGANGLWGTLAVGFFSTSTGLFYTGSGLQLGVQILGILCIAAWTALCMGLLFFILKKTIGLRVTETEEIEGLDKHEHGLPSAYADFVSAPLASEIIDMDSPAPVLSEDMALPALRTSSELKKMSKVVIVMSEHKLNPLKTALAALGVTGMTVTSVFGCGVQKGATETYRGVKLDMDLLPKVKVEVVVSKVPVDDVVAAARKVLYSGHIGDGKIFVYDVENVVKVRTGATGYDALQDEEG